MAAPTFPAAEDPAPVPTVATLRAGDEVSAVFACTLKERRIARTGAPFLDVELRDATGSIRGRAFREADVLAGRFERGELVHVRGRVERFREELQIDLEAIARARPETASPEQFLPVAYRDLEELEGFFEHLAREVADPGLGGLLERLLADRDLRAELRRAPCTPPPPSGRAPAGAVHHAYLGGLLEHTVAVGTLALELWTLLPRPDRDLLLCAALVHDIGKTREFSYGAEITRSQEGLMLGHVEIGLGILRERAPAALSAARRLALEHCVLLHHGPEPAAGRRFRSPEALALHRINALDAHVKAGVEHGVL